MTRSPTFWYALLGIAFLLLILRVILLFEHSTAGSSPEHETPSALQFYLILGASLVAIIALAGLCYQRGQIRNGVIARSHPDAVIVVGSRTPTMARTAKGIWPGVKVRTAIVWSIDANGATLWQGGGRHPVSALAVTKGQVIKVQHVTVNSSSRSFDAVSFDLMDPRGFQVMLPFLVRSPRRPLFPLGSDGVEKTVQSINRAWGRS